MKRTGMVSVILVGLWGLGLTPSWAAGKGEKEAIEKLTSEVLVLQRQVRDLQESMDRSYGQLIALVGQIADKVGLAAHAIQDLQTRMQDTQARVAAGLDTLDHRLLAQEANFRTINERLAQSLDQLAALNQMLAGQKLHPAVDLSDPVQVFSAAYGDYLRGNYQLAIEQFRQFLTRFPLSEQADDAQYWIGESFFNQGLYEQALSEFDLLLSTYPRGDKVRAARLKRAYTLLAMNQTENAIKELRQLLSDSPESAEAAAAKQRLEQLGVPVVEPNKPARGRRVRKT